MFMRLVIACPCEQGNHTEYQIISIELPFGSQRGQGCQRRGIRLLQFHGAPAISGVELAVQNAAKMDTYIFIKCAVSSC